MDKALPTEMGWTPSAKPAVISSVRYFDMVTGTDAEHPAIFVGAEGRIVSIADARTVCSMRSARAL